MLLTVFGCADPAVDRSPEGVFPRGDWRPVEDIDLRVEPGSVLDFTRLFPDQIASNMTAVTLDNQGRLANAARQRQRFLCAPLLFTGAHGGFPDHATADALALELRRRGYNLARMPLIDAALMANATRDFDFDEIQLDRFHYLLAALKRQGIYWMIDVASSWNGAYALPGKRRGDRNAHLLQLEIHYDRAARQHWKELARRALARDNPYSGQPPLTEANLLALTVINTGSILYNLERPDFATQKSRFNAWLEGAYAPTTQSERLQAYHDRALATTRWMTQVLRDLGYGGMVTGYNGNHSALTRLAARDLTLVSLHDFFDMPVNYIRPGNRQMGISAVGARAPDIRRLAAARMAGRPYIVDEYGQPFWSAWRREAGLLLPAYAAFQDWDAICRFGNPVELAYGGSSAPRNQAITPFGVGLDPIARAGETLAALLFRRGDIRSAEHRITLEMNSELAFDPDRAHRPLPEATVGLAFRHAVGLLWRDGASATEDPPEPHTGGAWSAELVFASDTPAALIESRLAPLGHPGGRGDAERGRYESDTGEIYLDAAARYAQVQSASSEALLFDRGLPLALTRLSVDAASEAALIALSAVDGRPLGSSRRMLLIFATDAVNSGIRFGDQKRHTLLKIGRLPVLIKTAWAELTVRHDDPAALRLFAVGLNGARRQELPLRRGSGEVRFRIDTAALAAGPTTYFELVADDFN